MGLETGSRCSVKCYAYYSGTHNYLLVLAIILVLGGAQCENTIITMQLFD